MRCLLIGLFAVGCAAAPPVRVEGEAFDVLERVRAAVGADALFEAREGLTLRGTRLVPGAEQGRPLTVALRPSGSFLVAVGGEGGASTRGFDGADGWERRPSGIVRRLDLGAREHLLADGFLRTHLWLVPGTPRFDVRVDAERSGPEELVLALERDGGRLGATVRVARDTMLPTGYELARFGRVRRVAFADWDGPGGARFPRTVREFVDGELLHVDRVDRVVEGTPPTFAAPLSAAEDTLFTAGAPPAVATRMDERGRYFVRAELDGGRPGWFLVDTGFGAHALTRAAAEALGLPVDGSAHLAGAGGAAASSWCSAGELELGPMRVAAPRFALLEEAPAEDTVGILGAPLFERAVVVLDDRSGSVSLFEPRAFRGDGLEWSPVARDGSAACVRGRVRGSRGWSTAQWLRLDTGSDDTLTVARWAVPVLGIEPDRTRLRPASLVGLFGRAEGWRTEVGGLEFAGASAEGADVFLLRDETEGPLSDPWIAGNLGAGALRGRRMVLDLPRERVSVSAPD